MKNIEVISVAKADRPLWIYRLSLDSIRRHFPLAKITIVCPNSDINLFAQLDSSHMTNVISENEYMPLISVSDLKQSLIHCSHRAGWYYQQFLKMQYCRHASSDHFLIWDLDTIMLNPIDLSFSQREFYFGSSSEYHLPYFHTIDKLLGRGSFPGFSSICQYMYVKTNIMSDLLLEIESKTGTYWPFGIISVLPQKCDSEFSEYETYATYVFRRYNTRFFFYNTRLFRFGSELASSHKDAVKLSARLSNRYDLLSFEQHIPSRLRRIYARFLYFLAMIPFRIY